MRARALHMQRASQGVCLLRPERLGDGRAGARELKARVASAPELVCPVPCDSSSVLLSGSFAATHLRKLTALAVEHAAHQVSEVILLCQRVEVEELEEERDGPHRCIHLGGRDPAADAAQGQILGGFGPRQGGGLTGSDC